MASSASTMSPIETSTAAATATGIPVDAADLDVFFDRHIRRLRRWARGRLGGRVRAGADTSDVIQEVLVRTIARLDVFRPRTHRALAAYLVTAVRHRLIDLHRHESRWQRRDMDERLVSREPSPFQQASDAETRRRYRDALSALSRRDQELIVGHLELDYSHGQLGCMIGRSANAARMALARAMARLAERMAQR